jgi:drug/metabolite transporter (DMT)-like permease
MDRRRLAGIGLALVSAASFGSGALFSKPVYAAGVGWLPLLAWRFLVGAAMGWLWLAVSPGRRAGLRALTRRRVSASVILGILYLGNSATYFAALETVSASLAALIVYVYPATVAVLTLRFGRRLEGRRAWAALALSLTGVVLALGGIPSGHVPPVSGLLEVCASPLIYSVWIVLQARLAGERRAAGEPTATGSPVRDAGATDAGPGEGEVASADGVAASAATALMMSASGVCFWILALATGARVLPADIPVAAWPGMLGIAIVSTFVAIQTFYLATERIGAAQTALVSTFEPVWTIGLAGVLFGERLGPIQLLGGALVIGGVLLSQLPTGAVRRWATLRMADE